MNIGIIDADLLYKKKHRFPNLACMKISSYYKQQGDTVNLLLSYDNINNYDKIFISKVFTDTIVPDDILDLPNVEYGGTGFFYDKAKPLPNEIEHIMPDYHLYDEFVHIQLEKGSKPSELQYYTDYSIGFTTRGCIRGCSFCVNKNYKVCNKHSSVSEFLDVDRKYICLLDDNVLSCKDWKSIFEELNATGKKFQFKQGLDERLLTDEKCEILFNSNWIGYYIFAFDNIKDKDIIEQKLNIVRKYTNKKLKFYCFCAYNHNTPDTYTDDFWSNDIKDLFERIKILMQYKCLPYIMRYKDYEKSPYRGMYINIASWCNQPHIFENMSFREFVIRYTERAGDNCATMRYMKEFEENNPDIANEYFDIKWKDLCKY